MTEARQYTGPGEYARRLQLTCRIDPPAYAPQLSIDAWAVVNGEVRRVTVIRLRSASGCGYSADYADCSDGRTVGTYYLFPVAKHCKPRVETVYDEYGACQQWVAPLKSRCVSAW